MTNRIPIIILALLAIGLGVAMISVRNAASKRQQEDADRIGTYSNKFNKVSTDLDEQRQVTAMLEKDLDSQKKAFGELTNNFSQISADLVKTEGSLKLTEEQVKQQETKINELETQKRTLDEQAVGLRTALTNLTTEIAQTQRKLAASEGDKAFLQKELKRMISEKSELERQFSDLTVLRAQVSRIKEDMAVARRLEWMKQGTFVSTEQKGAQRLMQGINPPARPPKSNYDLNVEVSADGSVKVIPPLTNSVAGTNSPPR